MTILQNRALSLIFLVSCLLLLVSSSAYAETNPRVYFKTTTSQVPPDSEFTIRILVDSSKPINAVDVEIRYSSETLELVSLNNSKSIIDFWRGGPEIPPAGNTINLQGGSVDSFSGSGGEIITLNFRAKKEGQAELSFTKVNLYYADGKGTLAQAQPTAGLDIAIIKGAKIESSGREEIDDKTPPIIETAKVAASPIDRSRLAVFHAVDNDSGIKNIEIKFRRWLAWSDWQKATNPVRLPNTAWTFQIKAVDNAGNTALKTVYVPQAIPNIILPLLAILAGIITISVLRRRKRGI